MLGYAMKPLTQPTKILRTEPLGSRSSRRLGGAQRYPTTESQTMGIALLNPSYELRAHPNPLPWGEGANNSLREFHVNDQLDIAALEKIKRGEDPNV